MTPVSLPAQVVFTFDAKGRSTSSVTGSAEAPACVGVSVADIAAGLNAYGAILEALMESGQFTPEMLEEYDRIQDTLKSDAVRPMGGIGFVLPGMLRPKDGGKP